MGHAPHYSYLHKHTLKQEELMWQEIVRQTKLGPASKVTEHEEMNSLWEKSWVKLKQRIKHMLWGDSFFRNGLILSWWTTSWPWASNAPSRQRWPTASPATLGKAGRVTSLSAEHWWRHTSRAVSSSGLLSTRNMWTYWSKSIKGPQICLRDWSIFHVMWGWESWDCLDWKREGSGGILSLCTNTWWEGVKEMKPVVPIDRARSNGHKLNHMKLYPNTRKTFYWESGQTLEEVAQGGCGVSIFGDIPDLTGHCPVQPAPADPAWAVGSAPSNLHDSVCLGSGGHKINADSSEPESERTN